MEQPRFHNPVPVLFDQFGIGQTAVARITAEMARQEMHDIARRAFRWSDDPSPLDLKRETEALAHLHAQAAMERDALVVLNQPQF